VEVLDDKQPVLVDPRGEKQRISAVGTMLVATVVAFHSSGVINECWMFSFRGQ
jgi:hypothetical protein